MKIEKNDYDNQLIMKDGTVYRGVPGGIIGLSPNLLISGGLTAYFDFDNNEMPPKHKKELADFMIDAWRKYKEMKT